LAASADADIPDMINFVLGLQGKEARIVKIVTASFLACILGED
jgi:hypothetical protein